MARCNFCRRTFGNAQAVRAHLRFCPAYQGREEVSVEGSAEGSVPKARLPRSGLPIERDLPMARIVPLEPKRSSTPFGRLLETELRHRRIEALQRKLDDPKLDPLEELHLMDQLYQEIKRL